MSRRTLTDVQWERLALLVPGKVGDGGMTGKDNRLFVDAVLWMARTGAPWRDLPGELGNWNSTWRRFDRWSRAGVWERLFEALADDPDFEYVIIDATIVRAHQHAAGQKGGAQAQALGRSRGGLSTKLHIAVDALGNPLRILLTPGQRHEMTEAKALITGFSPDFLIADTAYDSDDFRARLAKQGSVAVIPSNPSRAQAIVHDKHLYKERHAIECFINKIKQFRRIASRYEKTARNFLAMIHFAGLMVWLR